MTLFSRGLALGLLGTGLCGLAGCQEDNEQAAAKAQTGGTAPAAPVFQPKTQEEDFKHAQGQMKNMPGYNAAKAQQAQGTAK
jgi:hypothetical protein